MNSSLDKIHRILSRSSMVVRAAVKIRNQAGCIIAHHLGETANSERNGEYKLLGQLAPFVKTFVDVGANVGDWSSKMLEFSGKAHGFCFEPSGQCVERLKRRFAEKNVEIRRMALSSESGDGNFFEENGCGETSSLFGARNSAQGSVTTVKISTLDDEFSDLGYRIDLLKTDCEGWDLKVLQGGGTLLHKVKFVQFEYNSSWQQAGSSLFESLEYLKNFGFQIYLIKSSGLHLFQYDLWGDFYRYANFFACRDADLPAVEPIVGRSV